MGSSRYKRYRLDLDGWPTPELGIRFEFHHSVLYVSPGSPGSTQDYRINARVRSRTVPVEKNTEPMTLHLSQNNGAQQTGMLLVRVLDASGQDQGEEPITVITPSGKQMIIQTDAHGVAHIPVPTGVSMKLISVVMVKW